MTKIEMQSIIFINWGTPIGLQNVSDKIFLNFSLHAHSSAARALSFKAVRPHPLEVQRQELVTAPMRNPLSYCYNLITKWHGDSQYIARCCSRWAR
jgi:hypothetical protein